MIKVYMLESLIDNEVHSQIHLNIAGTNIWLADEGCSRENIVNIDWTDLFWKNLELDYSNDRYTYVGEL